MKDPFGSMQNFIGQFQQFMGNPAQFIVQRRLDIPQAYMKDPNEAIQYLMNTGKLSQTQYNELNKKAKQLENDPNFKKCMGIQ